MAGPGTHFGTPGRPPWTHVNVDRSIFCTGLWGPRGRGSAHPKVADTRRTSPPGNNSRGSVAHHWTHHAAPADPWLAPSFHQSEPDWLLSSPAHDKRARTPRQAFPRTEQVHESPTAPRCTSSPTLATLPRPRTVKRAPSLTSVPMGGSVLRIRYNPMSGWKLCFLRQRDEHTFVQIS